MQPHLDILYGYIVTRVKGPENAADIFQETLLAAWTGIGRFEGAAALRT